MSPARFSTGRTMAAREMTIRMPAKTMPASTADAIRISENRATLLARAAAADDAASILSDASLIAPSSVVNCFMKPGMPATAWAWSLAARSTMSLADLI